MIYIYIYYYDWVTYTKIWTGLDWAELESTGLHVHFWLRSAGVQAERVGEEKSTGFYSVTKKKVPMLTQVY